MKKTGRQLDREIAQALGTRTTTHARRRKKSPDEIRTERLKSLQWVMKDALGDPAWLDTDLSEIEKWISVDDDLSDHAWIDAAKDQLVDQSVLPEHAGAAPANVYRWNDVFISTYRMNVDDGMDREDAIESARQNAFDTVKLTARERELINANPDLYKDH